MRRRSLRRTLSVYRAGAGDPTTRLDERSFTHATYTPDGPATLLLTWRDDPAPADEEGLEARAWGPGAGWMLAHVGALIGDGDPGCTMPDADPVVRRALRDAETTWIGASANLYHLLLPTIVAQRITAREAFLQWGRLCRALGDTAPGPAEVVGRLRLPPSSVSLHRRPAWWFHRLGIESKRARALTEVARHAPSLWSWAEDGPAVAGNRLELIPGIGPWTAASAVGPACGDPDAVPVGDFHFPNFVSWNLAGEPRGDDDRMLELLAPYAGQRARVLYALVRHGRRPPPLAPRRRTLQIQHL